MMVLLMNGDAGVRIEMMTRYSFFSYELLVGLKVSIEMNVYRTHIVAKES